MPLSDKPVISVIMPAYNHEKYVEEAIMSVLNQEGVDFELIVINDGSQDLTAGIVDRLQNKYGFTFLSRPNKGLMLTIKEGLDLSRGKYIAFLASDDVYLPGRLSIGLECMSKCGPEVNAIYMRANVIDSTSGHVCRFEEIYPFPLFPEAPREQLFGNWVNAASVTYRHSFMDTLQFNPEIKIEDWYFLLHASIGGGLKYVNYCGVGYRIHGENSMFALSEQSIVTQQFCVIAKYSERFHHYLTYKQVIRRNPFLFFHVRYWPNMDILFWLLVRKVTNYIRRRNGFVWKRS
jgi:glycosyltransferase involved in cell wall biosynthesis